MGSSRRSQHLSVSGDAKENERKSAGGIKYSPDNLARLVDETETERSAASNSYMTSTQMAYMSGKKCALLECEDIQRRRTISSCSERYSTCRRQTPNSSSVVRSICVVYLRSMPWRHMYEETENRTYEIKVESPNLIHTYQSKVYACRQVHMNEVLKSALCAVHPGMRLISHTQCQTPRGTSRLM